MMTRNLSEDAKSLDNKDDDLPAQEVSVARIRETSFWSEVLMT